MTTPTKQDRDDVRTRHRAFRFALDPTTTQEKLFRRLAGASRMAYNTYVAEMRDRKERWDARREELTEAGLSGDDLKKAMKHEVSTDSDEPMGHISAFGFCSYWLTPARDDHKERSALIGKGGDAEAIMVDSKFGQPWLHLTPRRVQVSGIQNAGRAWSNWMDSLTGNRAGRTVGFPKFKRRRSGDSFTIPAPEKMGARGIEWGRGKNSGSIDDYRHIYAAFLGKVRTHDSTRKLVRSVERGGEIRSYTLSRGANRWYISFLVDEPFTPPQATRSQRQHGTVGVDVGVSVSAALSDGSVVENPRHGGRERRRVSKLQRKIARTQKGSNRRSRLIAQLAATHHKVAMRRETHAHRITKALVTKYSRIGVEDLNVAGMTASAKGTVDDPGTNVKAKAGLNRSVLDAQFGRIRRQLEYKAPWYGSELIATGRYMPSSKTCSECGTVKPKLELSVRVFTCECGYEADRDVNAARNIAAAADKLACDERERINGRRGPSAGTAASSSPAGSVEASRPPYEHGSGESPSASDCTPLSS